MTKNPIIKKLLSELLLYRKELIIIMISIGAVSWSMLSLGHTLKLFIDKGITAGNTQALNQTIIYLIIAVLVLAIGSFFRSFYINYISDKVVSNIRMKTYDALLHHQIKYFDKIKITDIISRFSHDLSLISDIITNLLSFSIRNFFLITGGMIMMFYQNVKLSIIVMLSVPISIALISKLSKKVRSLARDLHAKKAAIEGVINETLTNIRIVYSFDIQNYRIEKLTDISQESSTIAKKYLRIRALFFALAISMLTTLLLVVLWIGGTDVIDGTISSGDMVSFIFYAISTAFAIGGISEIIGELQKSFAAAERVFELQKEEAENINKRSETLIQDTITPDTAISSISFYTEKFFYPSRPEIQILHSIQLEASKGDFVGIAGPSGSGKSTILQLIMGLYRTDGEVKINNKLVDLSLMPDLVKRIAYVPQDPFLFSASIQENITLGRDLGRLDEVVEIVEMKEMIDLLPEGLDTYVGEKGMQLSGGQKQRIALARSLYGHPDIILLDEATSALDLHSENQIIKNLREFMKDKIIISIAHRLSSIKNATKIFLIHNGVVVANGNHHELQNISPLYKHLATFQNS